MIFVGAGVLFMKETPQGYKVLLGKRAISPGRGKWTIPGGKCEKNESARETALREAREEVPSINLTGKSKYKRGALFGGYTAVLPFFKFKTIFVMLNRRYIKKKIRHNFEFLEVKWFSIDTLPNNLHWGVKEAVQHAQSALIRKGEKIHEILR